MDPRTEVVRRSCKKLSDPWRIHDTIERVVRMVKFLPYVIDHIPHGDNVNEGMMMLSSDGLLMAPREYALYRASRDALGLEGQMFVECTRSVDIIMRAGGMDMETAAKVMTSVLITGCLYRKPREVCMDLMGLCIRRGLTFTSDSMSEVLIKAASAGYTDLCRVLVTRGARPCYNYSLALELAASSGQVEVCELLLDRRNPHHARPNHRNGRSLARAVNLNGC
jgi:hypothetical protein